MLTPTCTSRHQLAQLGKRLCRYLAPLISLNDIFLSLSFEDVNISFIRKNNSCNNSKESVPLTVHLPCTFLNHLPSLLSSDHPALQWILSTPVSCLIRKTKSQCSRKWSKGIPVYLKGKRQFYNFATYFFSKKLPFQQAAEDSIWTTLLFAAGRQKKTEMEIRNRHSSKSFQLSSLPSMEKQMSGSPLKRHRG